MARTTVPGRSSSNKYSRQRRLLLESLERRELLASFTTLDDKPLVVSDSSLASMFILAQPQHGTVSLTNVGGFVYTPKEDYNGPDAFVYGIGEATNTPGTTIGERITASITVTPVNDAPRGADTNRTLQPNSSYTLRPEDFGFSDPKDEPRNNLRAVKIVSLPAIGQLQNDGVPVESGQTIPIGQFVNNRVRYIAPAISSNTTTSASITFAVQDDGGIAEGGVDLDQSPNKLTIYVAPITQPKPEARPDSYGMPQNGTLTINKPGVLTNDAGINGRPLTVSLEPEKGPKNGTVELNSDGSFTYKPVTGFVGTDTFVYRATDVSPETGSLPPASSLATVTINVRSTAPIVYVKDDAYNAIQNTPLKIAAPGVLGNDVVYSGETTNAAGTVPPVLNLPLTAQIVTQPERGTLQLASDGGLEYVPEKNFFGSVSFTYKAVLAGTAAGGTLAPNPTSREVAKVTIYVKPPEAVNDFYSTPNATTLTIAAPGVLKNDRAPEGLPLSALLVSQPVSGNLEFNADGSFKYAPAADFFGSVSFSYRAIVGTATPTDPAPVGTTVVGDGQNTLGGLAKVTIYVAPKLPSVVANADQFETRVNVALEIGPPGILKNDYVIVGDPVTGTNGTPGTSPNYPLAAVLLNKPANGEVTLKADGSVRYVPKPNFVGTDTFTYRAVASTNTAPAADSTVPPRDIATVTIVVRPLVPIVNANDDVFDTKVNLALEIGPPGVLKNDYLIFADPITNTTTTSTVSPNYPLFAVLVDQPANGTVELRGDGSVKYVPKENFVGTDKFTYRAGLPATAAGDANLLPSDTATVTVNVRPIIVPPVAKNDEFRALQDSTLTINPPGVLANDQRPADRSYVVTLDTDVTNGELELTGNGGFKYTPTTGFTGIDTFTYYLAAATSNTTAASDADLLKSNIATVKIIVQSNRPIVYAFDDEYKVLAGGSLAIDKPGVLGNDTTILPPVILSSTGAIPVAVDPNTVDPNTGEELPRPVAPPLTAKLLSGPQNGELTFNPDGSFKYTPKANFVGLDTFLYRALVSTTTPPTGEVLTAASTDPSGNLFAPCTTNTPCPTYPDDIGLVKIFVRAPEPPPGPVAVNDFYLTAQNTPFGVGIPGVLGNDFVRQEDPVASANTVPGGRPPLTAVLVAGPANGSVVLNADGSFRYEPKADFVGTDTFTYQNILATPFPTLTDAAAADFAPVMSNIATVTIRVVPAVARNDSFTTDRDKPLEIASPGVLKNDAGGSDANPLKAALLSIPLHGTLKLESDGSFRYVPSVGYVGADTFTYRVSSGSAATDPATGTSVINAAGELNRPINAYDIGVVKIYVRPPALAVDARDDRFATPKNTALKIESPGVLANDYGPVNVPVFAAVVNKPLNGTLELNADGSFTYTPAADFVGEDRFTYRASVAGTSAGTPNSTIQGDIATVVIHVLSPETAPKIIIGQDQNTTDESGPQKVTDWAAVVSVDANGLPPAIEVTTDQPALFTAPPKIDPSGQLVYTPAPNASGTATVTVTIGDASAGEDTHSETFRIHIEKLHEFFNAALAWDINGDHETAADDVLALINYINANGSTLASEAGINALKKLFYDPDKDGWITATDVVLIINYINAKPAAIPAPSATSEIDDALLSLVAQEAADAASGKKKF
jgi:hypothetical protein